MASRAETEKEKLIERREKLEQLIKGSESKRDSVESISASKPRIYGVAGTILGFGLGVLGLNIMNSSINHYYSNTTTKELSSESYEKFIIINSILTLSFLVQSAGVMMLADTLRQVITTKVAYQHLASDYELTLKHYKELNEIQAKLAAIEAKPQAEPFANIPSSSLEASETVQSRVLPRNIE